MFFAAICVGGPVAAQLLKMPSLVGETFEGILLGPTLVPFSISFVMLGKTGLILLVIEAGIDIGLTMEATAADVVVPVSNALGFLVGGRPCNPGSNLRVVTG